jgi:hypothetical protein
MIRDFLETFRKPSAEVLAQRELEEARRSLLNAQSHYEYYKRLADYNADRVHRLTGYLRPKGGVQ